jgi:hypothetical protein
MTPPKIIHRGAHLAEDSVGMPAAHTYAGQAYFPGTEPSGRTCRECRFWAPPIGVIKHQYGGGVHRELKPCKCIKHTEFRGKPGQEVPHHAAACKYFEPSDSPPKIRERF